MKFLFKNKKLGFVLMFAIAVILLTLAINYPEWFHPAVIKEAVIQAGFWGPLLFISIYILCTLFFVPSLPLCLLGGLLFGLWWGTLYSLVGLAIGSSSAFLFARYCGANWINQCAGQKLHAMLKSVGESGWQLIAILRLLPMIPFTVLNYAFGLTPLRLSHFAAASFIFSIPAYFTYAYLGQLGLQISLGNMPILETSVFGISLIATLFLIPHCFKKFKTQLLILKSQKAKN